MGPIDKRVLAAFCVRFPNAEAERRFIEEANERFMVQVGTEISKTVPFEQIEEYLGLNSENISGCALWLQQNVSRERLGRLCRIGGGAEQPMDIARTARGLWMQKHCPDYQQIIRRVWRSFCGELRQMSGGAERGTSISGAIDLM